MEELLEYLKSRLRDCQSYDQYDDSDYIRKCQAKEDILTDIIEEVERIIQKEKLLK